MMSCYSCSITMVKKNNAKCVDFYKIYLFINLLIQITKYHKELVSFYDILNSNINKHYIHLDWNFFFNKTLYLLRSCKDRNKRKKSLILREGTVLLISCPVLKSFLNNKILAFRNIRISKN